MFDFKKWSLTIRIIPVVAFIVLLKYAFHSLGFEFLGSNPFLPSLVAATVFLIGFLISGVLADFKESEKLPGELASSIEAMADEAYIIAKNKKAGEAKEFLSYLKGFTQSLLGWFNRGVPSKELLTKVRGFNSHFASLEPYSQPAYLARMRNEAQSIRKTIIRIHTIKDTQFIGSGYAVAEGVSAILIFALLISKLEPFAESMFFMVPITYIFVYMIALIKDLDNPFEYQRKGESVEEVSLKEIHDELLRLDDRLYEIEALGLKPSKQN